MRCTIGKGKPVGRRWTDTQMLNWIESQGRPRLKWIARPSFQGRGYRLHQVTLMEQRVFGEELCAPTIREAIEIAMAKSLADAKLKHPCRESVPHVGPCGPVYKQDGLLAKDECACGCNSYDDHYCMDGAC